MRSLSCDKEVATRQCLDMFALLVARRPQIEARLPTLKRENVRQMVDARRSLLLRLAARLENPKVGMG